MPLWLRMRLRWMAWRYQQLPQQPLFSVVKCLKFFDGCVQSGNKPSQIERTLRVDIRSKPRMIFRNDMKLGYNCGGTVHDNFD